jgi:hypothetical protein
LIFAGPIAKEEHFMTKRFKHISRPGWFIIGAIVAILLVPSVAVAAGLKFTGIEGTSGHQADVSPSGQVLTAPADPSSYFSSIETADYAEGILIDQTQQVYVPPSGDAAVVTTIQSGYWDVGSISNDPFFQFYVGPVGCSASSGGHFFAEIDPSTNGGSTTPVTPGQVVPAGDALCVAANDLDVDTYAQGYTIPSADASPESPAAQIAKH